MFTGLVQDLGRVVRTVPDSAGGRTLAIACRFAAELQLGESVAVNGCCLTVIQNTETEAEFQAGPETLLKTNLDQLQLDSPVNLERALRVGDRLGGHFVSGHVDTVGRLESREQDGEWQMLYFTCAPVWLDLMVPKGSICVDGVSLTVVDVLVEGFTVMLIPHTLAHTTLGSTPIRGPVNLETDILAKHVRQLLRTGRPLK
jgi:riboflavin synthase